MSPVRRTRLAAAASILWMLAVAAPVWAAATLNAEEPPPNDPYFRSTSGGRIVVRGTVGSDDPIESVTYEFTPPLGEGGACAATLEEERFEVDPANDRSGSFELVIATPCNRRYEVRATVVHRPFLFGVGRPGPQTTPAVPFAVAAPPAPVKGLKATYDPASKKVDLTWSANGEADIIGYRVERNPPGPDGFQPVGGLVTGTSFSDTLTVDEEHRYRVIAVRSGPDSRISEVPGEPSSLVTSGPDRTEETVPDTTLVRPPAADARGAGSTSARGRTGSAGAGGAGGGASNAPQVRRGPVTTVDDGFGKTLPFDPSQTTSIPDAPAVPPEDAAVLALDDELTEDDDRRATLVPIAGGLALLMGAVHLRLLSRRAAEPDLPIYQSTPRLR